MFPSLNYPFSKEHVVATKHSDRLHKSQSHGKEKAFSKSLLDTSFNQAFSWFKEKEKKKKNIYFLYINT